jgi:hypothetical protein
MQPSNNEPYTQQDIHGIRATMVYYDEVTEWCVACEKVVCTCEHP